MFKLHLKKMNKKECISLTIDFKHFVQQKHGLFYESTCSMDEFDEKSNHTKTSKFEHGLFYESTCSLDEFDEKSNHIKISKFERKGYKAKYSFKKPFDIKIMFNELKMSNFRCRSHVQIIILPKKCSLVH